jgi:signal peptidase
MLARRLLVAALLGTFVGLLGAGGALWSQGYRVYAVHTGSMTPTYTPGDLVVDAPADALPRVGSVITFRSGGPDGVTTHRVHGRTAAGLQTKGDANRTPDVTPVPLASVVGRVLTGVPDAGYVLVFFQQPAGIGASMSLALSLALAWRLFFPAPATSRPVHATA